MIVSIHQPQYIPWPGYFAKILSSDIFVFYENAQYQKNSIINRNAILIDNKETFLTIPVGKTSLDSAISEKTALANKWRTKHLKSLDNSYRKCPFHAQLMEIMNQSLSIPSNNLAEIVMENVRLICNYLGITTKILKTADLSVKQDSSPTGKLIEIIKNVNGSSYISGSGGKNYLDQSLFTSNDIELKFCSYYPSAYPQQNAKIENLGLSILDMIANISPEEILEMLKKNWRTI